MSEDRSSEKTTTKYMTPESKKTVLVEGYQISFADVDPSVITIGFIAVGADEEASIFSEIGLTLLRAKKLQESLQGCIEECEKRMTES
ncbi:MAG: hypothetical protein NWE88_00530 [Candidatus Bathyarchaeota archaeon]|nr:hypothetical protein [Candidatus Bathyarchaeota archaeon]